MERGYSIVRSRGAHYLSLVAHSGTILSNIRGGSFTSGYRGAVIFVGVVGVRVIGLGLGLGFCGDRHLLLLEW